MVNANITVDASQRFDVIYGAEHPSIEPHFCRTWTEDENGDPVGCYGTDPSHGYSFEDACDVVAAWHEREAKEWRDRTHAICRYYLDENS